MSDATFGASGLWLGTRTGAGGTATLAWTFFDHTAPWTGSCKFCHSTSNEVKVWNRPGHDIKGIILQLIGRGLSYAVRVKAVKIAEAEGSSHRGFKSSSSER